MQPRFSADRRKFTDCLQGRHRGVTAVPYKAGATSEEPAIRDARSVLLAFAVAATFAAPAFAQAPSETPPPATTTTDQPPPSTPPPVLTPATPAPVAPATTVVVAPPPA